MERSSRVLLITLFWGCMVAFCSGETVPCTSEKTFDSDHQLCCNRTVIDKREGLNCCSSRDGSGELLMNDEKICCEGKVHERRGRNLECCGDQPYDISTNVCCHESLHQRAEEMMCCGGLYLNRSQYLCCRHNMQANHMKREPNIDLQCCGSMPYNRNLMKCSSSKRVISKEEDECGSGQIFSLRKHRCCSGKLHAVPTIRPHTYDEKDPTQECCYTELYNITEQKCCQNGIDSYVIANEDSLECCHTTPKSEGFIIKDTEICCDTGKRKRLSGVTLCCGNGTYEHDKEGCCWGKFVFNRTSQRCCQGVNSSSVADKNARCCGGRGLEKDEVCCDDQPVKRRGKGHDVCSDGTKKKSLTCNGKPYMDALPTEKCCGSGINKYNEDTQACCENGVFNISSNVASCCRGMAYSIYDDNPCMICGGKQFSPANHTCCGDRLYKLQRGKWACCGNQVYQSRRHHCCKGGLVLPKKDGRCCGPFPISRRFARCDRKRRVPLTGNVKSADFLCSLKQRRNTLNAPIAACALPIVMTGSVTSKKQMDKFLNLTLTNVKLLPLQLGEDFQGQVPSDLQLLLPLPSSRCSVKHLQKIIVMLSDDSMDSTKVDSLQDLRTKTHFITVHSKKVMRTLKRSLSAPWCQQICKSLGSAGVKLLGIDKCYRSMVD